MHAISYFSSLRACMPLEYPFHAFPMLFVWLPTPDADMTTPPNIGQFPLLPLLHLVPFTTLPGKSPPPARLGGTRRRRRSRRLRSPLHHTHQQCRDAKTNRLLLRAQQYQRQKRHITRAVLLRDITRHPSREGISRSVGGVQRDTGLDAESKRYLLLATCA